MRSKLLAMTALAASACAALLGFIATKIASPRWEYEVVAPSDYEIDRVLEQKGQDGWEIVSARRATSSVGGGASYELILKRPTGAKSPPQLPVIARTAVTPDPTTIIEQSMKDSTTTSTPMPPLVYPAPSDHRAKEMQRACIDGKPYMLEGSKWVPNKILIGDGPLTCVVQK